jgi:hypothetical protein
VLDIVHGRFAYPVYGLRVSTPAVAEIMVAIFYGGLHAIGIVFGIATLGVSLAMKRGVYGNRIAYLGFATGGLLRPMLNERSPFAMNQLGRRGR